MQICSRVRMKICTTLRRAPIPMNCIQTYLELIGNLMQGTQCPRNGCKLIRSQKGNLLCYALQEVHNAGYLYFLFLSNFSESCMDPVTILPREGVSFRLSLTKVLPVQNPYRCKLIPSGSVNVLAISRKCKLVYD